MKMILPEFLFATLKSVYFELLSEGPVHRHGQREDRDGGHGGVRVRLGPQELSGRLLWAGETLSEVRRVKQYSLGEIL